jgi:flagellar protein FlgJ
MEPFSIGLEYFNDLRANPSLTSGAAGRANPGAQDFAELLERTRASSEAAPQNQAVDKNDRLYQLCVELETFLVKNLLTSMRNTVQKSGLIDQGFAGKMYEDMLYDEYAKDFTKNAGFGLAEQAYLQLSRYA